MIVIPFSGLCGIKESTRRRNNDFALGYFDVLTSHLSKAIFHSRLSVCISFCLIFSSIVFFPGERSKSSKSQQRGPQHRSKQSQPDHRRVQNKQSQKKRQPSASSSQTRENGNTVPDSNPTRYQNVAGNNGAVTHDISDGKSITRFSFCLKLLVCVTRPAFLFL